MKFSSLVGILDSTMYGCVSVSIILLAYVHVGGISPLTGGGIEW